MFVGRTRGTHKGGHARTTPPNQNRPGTPGETGAANRESTPSREALAGGARRATKPRSTSHPDGRAHAKRAPMVTRKRPERRSSDDRQRKRCGTPSRWGVGAAATRAPCCAGSPRRALVQKDKGATPRPLHAPICIRRLRSETKPFTQPTTLGTRRGAHPTHTQGIHTSEDRRQPDPKMRHASREGARPTDAAAVLRTPRTARIRAPRGSQCQRGEARRIPGRAQARRSRAGPQPLGCDTAARSRTTCASSSRPRAKRALCSPTGRHTGLTPAPQCTAHLATSCAPGHTPLGWNAKQLRSPVPRGSGPAASASPPPPLRCAPRPPGRPGARHARAPPGSTPRAAAAAAAHPFCARPFPPTLLLTLFICCCPNNPLCVTKLTRHAPAVPNRTQQEHVGHI